MAKARKSNAVPANITPVTIVHEDTDTHIVLKGVPTVEIPAPVAPIASPVVDAIESVLGIGGEVTVPVASPTNLHGVGKFNLSQSIRDCLSEHGIDTPRETVLASIKDKHGKAPEADFTTGSFSNSLSVIRAKMREGNGTGHTKAGAAVDLTDAVKLCQALRMAPAALAVLLSQVQAVGTIESVQTALAKVCELYELMNAGKTV